MINRNQLEANLVKVFFNCCSKRKYTDAIQKNMFRKYGYPIGQTNRYLMGMSPLSQASEQELFWFTSILNILYQEFQNDKINVIEPNSIVLTDYFTEDEISLYKNTTFIQKIQDSYPIILDKLLQVESDQWVCVKDIEFLEFLYDRRLIQCQTLFQPNILLEIPEGVNTHTIPLDKEYIRNIVSSIENRTYLPKTIILNLNVDDPTVEFDYSSGRLILKKGKFNIIDIETAHQFAAYMKVYRNNKDVNFNFVLKITGFTEKKALQFIFQENSHAKIDKRCLRPLNAEAYPNVVINKLNSEDDSCLNDKIGSKSGNIVNNVQLFNLIDYLYELNDKKEAEALAFKLKYLFNKLLQEAYVIDFFVLTVILKCSTLDITPQECIDVIKNIILRRNEINESRFISGKVKKNIFTEIEKLL